MNATDAGRRVADLIAFVAVLVVATWLVVIVHEATTSHPSPSTDCAMIQSQNGGFFLTPAFCGLRPSGPWR